MYLLGSTFFKERGQQYKFDCSTTIQYFSSYAEDSLSSASEETCIEVSDCGFTIKKINTCNIFE